MGCFGERLLGHDFGLRRFIGVFFMACCCGDYDMG